MARNPELEQEIVQALQRHLGADRDYVPEVRQFLEFLTYEEEQWKVGHRPRFEGYQAMMRRRGTPR